MQPPQDVPTVAPSVISEHTAYRVKGVLKRDLATLTGWCWSPDRPSERLRVALLIDGKRWGGMVAARFDPDLQRDGLCDGYHAFSRPLPAKLPAHSVIEAIEVGTGAVFGRLLAPEMESVRIWEQQADSIAADIASMHESCPPDPDRSTYLSFCTALRVSANLLARGVPGRPSRRSPPPWPPSPAPLPSGLLLPDLPAPRFSLVFDAAPGRAATLGAIVRLAPALRHYNSEVLVIDDGTGIESAALATLAGPTYCLTQSDHPVTRAHLAVEAARAPTILFMGAHDISLAELDDLLTHAAAHPSLILGGILFQIAARAGIGDIFPPPKTCYRPTGLVLLTPRELFSTLGGFDAELHDGEHLPELDFAMRALVTGARVQGWLDPVVNRLCAAPAFAVAARRRFAERWGRTKFEK